MVRNIEKLIKIENPRKITNLDTIEVFPSIPKLDLTDIETHSEQSLNCHIDLGLDQLEEKEE
jgi:hypothetical protein